MGTAQDTVDGIANFTLDTSGAGRYTSAILKNVAGDGVLSLGRKDNVSSAPKIYFNSGTTSSPTYDAKIEGSGGDGTDGSGALDVRVGNVDAFTINSNIIWNAGNLLFSPGFDANDAYDTNVNEYLVQRDASGNFAANDITASLTGAASLNVLKTGDTMTGSLLLSGANTDLQVGGNATVNGDTTLSGGLIVDATTLVVSDTDNRVLIGQTTGTHKLDIKLSAASTTATGDIGLKIEGDAEGDPGYVGIRFVEPNSTANQDGYIALARTSSTAFLGMEIQNRSRDGIRFLTSPDVDTAVAERLRIKPSGGVTIASAGTNYALDVEGKTRVTEIFIDDAADNSGSQISLLGSTTRRNFRISDNLSGSGLFSIVPSVSNGGTNFNNNNYAFVVKGGGGIIAVSSTATADPGRTANGSWTNVPSVTVTTNGGSGATFDVTTDANGLPTVTVNNPGDNYQIFDDVRLESTNFGGGANINLQVTDLLDGQVGIGTNQFSSNVTGDLVQYQLNVEGNVNFNGTLYQNNEEFITSRWTLDATNETDAYRLSKIGVNTSQINYTLTVGTYDGSAGDIGMSGILYVNDEPQWVDKYGVIKTSLNTIAEDATIPDNTNGTSIGGIFITSNATVDIGNNSTWVII